LKELYLLALRVGEVMASKEKVTKARHGARGNERRGGRVARMSTSDHANAKVDSFEFPQWEIVVPETTSSPEVDASESRPPRRLHVRYFGRCYTARSNPEK
jgi:hypothetical protein